MFGFQVSYYHTMVGGYVDVKDCNTNTFIYSSTTSFLNTHAVNRSSANWLHCGPELGLSLGAPSLTVLSLMSYANTSVVVVL